MKYIIWIEDSRIKVYTPTGIVWRLNGFSEEVDLKTNGIKTITEEQYKKIIWNFN